MMWANCRDTVKLKFEAFAAGSYNQICAPVYSQRIRYKSMTFTVNVIKSIFLKIFLITKCYLTENPNENELRIVKIVQAEGFCTGNEEVCMLVEKVSKSMNS